MTTLHLDTVTDADLAVMVRDALRRLSSHSPAYANAFTRCPGVRLAGDFNAGLAATATVRGREALEDAWRKVTAACDVPPGLDTNDLMDRVTGRRNPRLDRQLHTATDRERAADDDDRPPRFLPSPEVVAECVARDAAMIAQWGPSPF